MESLSRDGDFVRGTVRAKVLEYQWDSDRSDEYYQAVRNATAQRFYGKGLNTAVVSQSDSNIGRYVVDTVNMSWRINVKDYPNEDDIIKQFESDSKIANDLIAKFIA